MPGEKSGEMSRREMIATMVVVWAILFAAQWFTMPPRPQPAPKPPVIVQPDPEPTPAIESKSLEPGSVTARVHAAFVAYENRVADAWQKLADNPPANVNEGRERTRPLVAAAREQLEADLEAIFRPALGDGVQPADAATFFRDAAAGARRVEGDSPSTLHLQPSTRIERSILVRPSVELIPDSSTGYSATPEVCQ